MRSFSTYHNSEVLNTIAYDLHKLSSKDNISKFKKMFPPSKDKVSTEKSNDGEVFNWTTDSGLDVKIQEDIGNNDYILSIDTKFSSPNHDSKEIASAFIVLHKHSSIIKDPNILTKINKLLEGLYA